MESGAYQVLLEFWLFRCTCSALGGYGSFKGMGTEQFSDLPHGT